MSQIPNVVMLSPETANAHLLNDLNLSALQEVLHTELGRRWRDVFAHDLSALINQKPHSDLPRWLAALSLLPTLSEDQVAIAQLKDGVDVQLTQDAGEKALTKAQQEDLLKALQGLIPWRKGPFQLFTTFIDTEWQSNLKWERICQHVDLHNRSILDVGCGNGYYGFRMLGAGAKMVLGIDPSYLFLVQFLAIKKYMPNANIWQLPCTLDHFKRLNCFDVTFSMGVLYHRKSPLDHLTQLYDTLQKGGTLVLETMVVEGDEHTVLVPKGRYSQMRNVWFLPSVDLLILWLERLGFHSVRCVDVSTTSVQEQRATAWMRYQSLQDFLNPEDPSKTIEGYPAPMRAILVAIK